MVEKVEKCSSCNKKIIDGATRFMCPSCGKVEIVRCKQCKKLGIKYKCSGCGFSGPN